MKLAAAILPMTLAIASCSPPDGHERQPSGRIAADARPVADGQLADDADGSDWPAFGRTYGEQHFSPLTDINLGNVSRLKLAWSYDLPPGNSVSGPLEIGGVLYTATGYSIVRAFDAATGRLLWQYDPKVTQVAGAKLRVGWGIRGLAWWQGRLFVGTQDGRLIAINAADGTEAWRVMTVDKADARFISGPPRVFRGRVIIGHGGADSGATRGYVTAYDTATGRQLWRFYTVPGNPADGFEDKAMAMAARTWSGEWWKKGGGGTVWNAMTYDADLDTILIGTGNGAPWNRRLRSDDKGDNLFLASIVALDAKTGAYKWHYQVNPGETWDYNASMDMQIATLAIDGKPRKVVLTAPKNGFLYVIDRTDGRLISAQPVSKVTWASGINLATGRPIENPAARFPNGQRVELWPGPDGAHNWMPMSFDRRSGIVYIPTFEMPGFFDDRGITRENWHRLPGNAVDVGVNFSFDNAPAAAKSALVAWDVARQKQVWRVTTPGVWNGGTMATAGGLLFQGNSDGDFSAFDLKSGKRVWRFYAGAGVLAPPITYRVNGRQYVTVLSGFGTSGGSFGASVAKLGWQYRTQKRRVLTFMLDGTATVPWSGPERATPAADPGFRADAALAAKGLAVYGAHCLSCHGGDAYAAGLAPDLRQSTVKLDAAAFDGIVRGGALEQAGMPKFGELTDVQMTALRQYLRTASRQGASR